MQINIAVMDDEGFFTDLICKMAEEEYRKLGYEAVCAAFSSPAELLNTIRSANSFDLFFLDVETPGNDGIQLAAQLNSLLTDPLIIFVTNRDDRVFEAVRTRPLRYIRKSRLEEEFAEAAAASVSLLHSAEKKNVHFEYGSIHLRFKTNEIVYIEAQNQNIFIHTSDSKIHKIRFKISNAENILEDKGFIRIHKGYLVNFQYIREIRQDAVILDDYQNLPLSKYRKEEAKLLYLRFTDRERQL